MKKVPYEDLRAFTGDLVKGVLQHKEEVDAAITSHLKNWDLNRIAVIDKNVMRIALYELFYCDDIPREVTINEAIEAAKRYGSEESHHFVNAILDQVRPLEPESRL
jgi:N utilization substance protein B